MTRRREVSLAEFCELLGVNVPPHAVPLIEAIQALPEGKRPVFAVPPKVGRALRDEVLRLLSERGALLHLLMENTCNLEDTDGSRRRR